MKIFNQNITNTFGEKGKAWLVELPNIIKKLSAHWHLTHLSPVDNMSYHYVAKAVSDNHQAVVLKIGCDAKVIADEKQALEYFNGDGSIRLIDYNEKYRALLLQQAVPGVTLKSLYPAQAERVMDNYVATMQQLHHKILPTKNNFQSISTWLQALDKVNSDQIPKDLLKKALGLRDQLLSSSGRQVLLHGDLHHDNILSDGNTWLAIDPKGIIGEPEFEIAAFDFIHQSELAELANEALAKKLFAVRIEYIAGKMNLDAERIKAWVFVRLILSAAWSIEDKSEIGVTSGIRTASFIAKWDVNLISDPGCPNSRCDPYLREPKLEDEAAFIAAMQRSQSLHQPWVKVPMTSHEFRAYYRRYQQPSQKSFLVCDESGNIVGVFNLNEVVGGLFQSAYLGFYAVAEYAGRGYMNAGLKLVLQKAFEELDLHRIEANIQPENKRSINLVKNNGFTKEGFSPRYLKINGEWRDHERWALTYEDWLQKTRG